MLKFVWNFIFKLTGSDISFSVSYYNWDFFLIELPADYQGIEGILARRKLIPLKDPRGNARIQIAGCDMKDVQIVGPYYEITVQVPVEALDGSEHAHYTHLYLPVTTESARWPGVDISGFPKFISRIDRYEKDHKIHWRLGGEEMPVLMFEIEDVTGPEKRIRWDYYGIRKGALIKTVFEIEGKIFEGEAGQNTKLTLGEHPIAVELGKLLLSDEVTRIITGHGLKGKLIKPVPARHAFQMHREPAS